MHLVLDRQVFRPDRHCVVADFHHLAEDSAPHGHGFIEVVVVVGGSAVHRSAHGEHHLDRGSALLLRPGQWHGYDDAHGLELWNVYIGSNVLARELVGFQADPILAHLLWGDLASSPLLGMLHDADLARAEATLHELAECSGPGPVAQLECLGRLLVLLSHLGGLSRPAGSGHRTARAIAPAVVESRRLLEAHLSERWTLAGLAAAVHVSPGHLSRRFRGALGSPPLEYLSRRRAERAANLLIETDISVAEIGRIVGWPDPNYMTRRFRSLMGLTPTAYRSAFSPAQESGVDASKGLT